MITSVIIVHTEQQIKEHSIVSVCSNSNGIYYCDLLFLLFKSFKFVLKGDNFLGKVEVDL